MTTRGPFHLFSVNYCGGVYGITTLKTETLLREYIYQSFEDYPKILIKLQNETTDELMAYIQKHQGQNMIDDKRGDGLVAIVEGGSVIAPIIPTLEEYPEYDIDEINQRIAKIYVSGHQPSSDQIVDILGYIDNINYGMANNIGYDYWIYRNRFKRILSMKIPQNLKNKIDIILVHVNQYIEAKKLMSPKCPF